MNQPEEASKIVYSFPRGENEKVQIELRPYKGRYYIDLRLWFQSTPDSPFAPTKKGVSFSSDHLTELKEGMRQLDQACQDLKPKFDPAAKQENKPRTNSGSFPKRQSSAWAGRSSS